MTLEITEENLKKAHENGCSDVKKVLENLFPGAFKPKEYSILIDCPNPDIATIRKWHESVRHADGSGLMSSSDCFLKASSNMYSSMAALYVGDRYRLVKLHADHILIPTHNLKFIDPSKYRVVT